MSLYKPWSRAEDIWNLEKKPFQLRPWSVDVMEKTLIEKKCRDPIFLFFNFLTDQPTDGPTDWTKLARHKSAIQGIN